MFHLRLSYSSYRYICMYTDGLETVFTSSLRLDLGTCPYLACIVAALGCCQSFMFKHKGCFDTEWTVKYLQNNCYLIDLILADMLS